MWMNEWKFFTMIHKNEMAIYKEQTPVFSNLPYECVVLVFYIEEISIP